MDGKYVLSLSLERAPCVGAKVNANVDVAYSIRPREPRVERLGVCSQREPSMEKLYVDVNAKSIVFGAVDALAAAGGGAGRASEGDFPGLLESQKEEVKSFLEEVEKSRFLFSSK